MEESTIMTREDSLVSIKGWNFMPNQNGKISPIPLTMPKGITVEELGDIVRHYATRVMADGDVRPGTASLLVFSESLARDLIASHGSYLIKKKAFIDVSAL